MSEQHGAGSPIIKDAVAKTPVDNLVKDKQHQVPKTPVSTDREKSVGLQKTQAALERFRNDFGLDIDENGVLQSEPSDAQLAALHTWHKNTTRGSIIMPTEEIFIDKVLLARALMPQVNEAGQVQYLFGKGTGIELALQGEVAGRVKNEVSAPYRTHSDFEIYAAASDNYDVIPHSARFRAVFGSQEIYPVHKTKGLKDLPPDFLRNTAETVDFNGIDILVPKLEVQFVDKFESANEPVERRLRDKTDAEWLASLYPMDSELVHSLLDDYVIAPELAKLKPVGTVAGETIGVLERKIAGAVRRIRAAQQGTEIVNGDAIANDFVLREFCTNKGIGDVTSFIDSTGALRDDALVTLAVMEQRKQTEIKEILEAKHSQVDTILTNN